MNKKYLIFIAAVVCGTNAFIHSVAAQGTALTYQGRLVTGGAPAQGNFDFAFELYDASVNGDQQGPAVTNAGVAVNNGLFTVTNDFGQAPWTGQPLWIQLLVRTNGNGPFTTLAPRQLVTSTPYAIQALNASTAATAGTASSVNAANISGPILNSSLPASPNFSGTVAAGAFSGNGNNVTGVNASELNGLTAASLWQLSGNTVSAGQFLGSVNDQPLELWVNGGRALRLEPGQIGFGNPNVIGGSQVNFVSPGVQGATIGGGGAVYDPHIGESQTNSVTDDFGYVGGGDGNTAGYYSTTAGGLANTANGPAYGAATVAGGANNHATADYATVAGGEFDNATGINSAVGGGYNNTASGAGAFVGGGGYDGSESTGNSATGGAATVGGGLGNLASGHYSTVAGGFNNTASFYIGATVGGGAYNTAIAEWATVAGGTNNEALSPAAFIGGGNGNLNGGLAATVGGGQFNYASQNYAAIGGGYANTNSGDYGAISGGIYNVNAAQGGTIGGGENNIIAASASYATIPGGANNTALGKYSFAAGRNAAANDDNSFLWSDGSRAGATQGPNSFSVLATNGIWFFSGVYPAGVKILPGQSAWTTISDRNAKKNFQPVDIASVLEKLAAIPIQKWNYKWEKDSDVPNIGPMAQDFKSAFYPGRDDTGITTLEFDGVELAAIQGLNQKVEKLKSEAKEKDEEIQALKARAAQVDSLEKRLNDIEQRVQTLAAEK